MLKTFSTYLGFSVINAGLTFLTSVYLARTLSYESFGLIGILLAVLYFALPMAAFNSLGLVAINKVKLDSGNFQNFANGYFALTIIIFIISLVGVYIASLFITQYQFVLILMPVYTFIFALGQLHNAELIQEGKSTPYGLYLLLTRVLVFVTAFLLIELYNHDWMSYIAALISAEVIVLGVRFFTGFNALKNVTLVFDFEQIKPIIFYGIPVFFVMLAGWGLNQADRFIVLEYFSLKEVAHYTVAYTLGMIINTVNAALTNTVVPKIYRAINEGDAIGIVKKYTFVYFGIISVLIICFALTASFFIPLFYGEKYIESVEVAILIAVAFGVNGVYRISGLVIDFYKMNVLKTKIIFAAMLINVGLSILLINDLGIIAPAVGTIVAFIFLATASQIFGLRKLKLETNKQAI